MASFWAGRKTRAVDQLVGLGLADGRGGEIRTHGLYDPNVALYQAKLHPADICKELI